MIKKCSNCKKDKYVKPCRAREINFCSNSCTKIYLYANGLMDGKVQTEKAHQTLKEKGHYKRNNEYLFGSNNWAWRGGTVPAHKKIRNSWEYQVWRQAVFLRDNFTCAWCGQRGGELNADHIKPFALYPALRFAIDNGRTLCVSCHKKTDTFGSKTRI